MVSTVSGDTLGQACFRWDAVPDPIVCGYKVYWGTQSREYNHILDAANATEINISEFTEGSQYFLAVTSYSDTGEESDYSAEISFTVLPADGTPITSGGTATTPVITTQPTATAIIYGQTLASSALSGGVASVPGSFAFTTPTVTPTVGTTTQSVTFTPADTINYQSITLSVNVTVSKATPLITTRPSASAITYGQTLNNSTLSGGVASVPGSFYFMTPTSSPTVGTAMQSVTFIPADTNNYQTVITGVYVTVNRPVTTISLGNLTATYDGTPKAASATTNPPGLTVKLTYNGSTTAPTNAGSYAVLATIVDAYRTISASGTLVIAKATPSITKKPTARSIARGQTLARATLRGGTASVPGSFAFTKPTTVPAVGMALQSVTFTPTDTTNYLTITTTVVVTVKASGSQSIAPESLASWRARCFSPKQIAAGQAADDADPDGDGLENFAEYALGTDPLVLTPPLTAVKNSEGLVLTFERPAGLPDVLYAAVSSDDLIHWNPCRLELVAEGPVQTMRAIDPLTSGNPARRFISLRFTKPAKSEAIAQESLENWRTRRFSPEQVAAGLAADDGDPDHDGLVNLAEYALGTNPLASTPPLTAVKNSQGLVLTFERPSGLLDVLYAAASSDDLIHWNPCRLEMIADGPVQTMRAVDPLTSGNPARRFISLRFTKP